MRTLCCAFFAALLFTALNLSAEGASPLSEKVGRWSFSMSEPADLQKVSAETQQKLRSSLQDISRIITSSPAMSPPKGFEARFWGTVTAKDSYYICTGKKCPPARPSATLAMMLGRYEERNGKVRAAFNTPSTMDISINNLGHVFAHLPVFYRDAGGCLVPEPQLDGERAGILTYKNSGHAVSVLAGNDKPLWLPVSRERYLQAAIAAAAKGAGENPQSDREGKQSQASEAGLVSGKPVIVETVKTWIDPADKQKRVESSRSLAFELKEPVDLHKERLNKLRAELAALTPEQRTMQARVASPSAAGDEAPSLLPPDSSSGVAVVSPDFSYFNPGLPPEAAQLIVVQWKFDGNLLYDPEQSGISETLNNRKLLEIYKAMDWQKLRSKVTRTAP